MTGRAAALVGLMTGIVLGATDVRGQPDDVRIAPLGGPPAAWPAEVRDGVTAYGADPDRPGPLVSTLARHPDALEGIGPLARYIRESALAPAVDQVLLGLRMAWRAGSEVVWADLTVAAGEFGLTDADLRRVAEGPEAGWGLWDATVIRAADELHRDAVLSDRTWSAMADRYNDRQLIDILFTGAEYSLLSMLANSLGVRPDPGRGSGFPTGVPRLPPAAGPAPARPATARLEPLPPEAWTEEQRELLDPAGTGEPPLNLFATLVRHPVFYRPRATQSRYIRTRSTLSGRVREMLILRMGWRCAAEYEWAQHAPIGRAEGLSEEEIRAIAAGPSHPVWSPFEAALLRAVDDLHQADRVSDEVWSTLSAEYGERELIDVVITAAGYRMVSMALNTLGVQLESGLAGFPDGLRP